MKHTFFTVLVFITMASMGQEVCEPNGVSTHPDNPANPAAPSPLWLNEFNWYDHEGTTLYQYALNDMLNYNPNQFNMTHPYDYPNSYGYLIDPIPGPNTIDDLDMFPEDGWELLSVNLGAYPNGALLSEQSPPQQSGLSEIPYLLLYNKNRGIIRLFANSLTGLTENYKSVYITLSFFNQNKLSGLLRHNGGMDVALDQQTTTTTVSTLVTHPNNPMLWFHADFQVGYDPCTCIYQSDIQISFKFIQSTSIHMVSNEISTDVAIVDAQGNPTLSPDFLAGINYQDGYQDAGLVVYQNMEKMIDDYIARLEAVEAHNIQVGLNADVVKRKKTILNIFKFVIIGGVSSITGGLANDVQQFANNLLDSIGIDGSVKVIKGDVVKETKKILGKGFDWLSKEWITEPQGIKPAPNMPTATISQSTFDGVINEETVISGLTLFNPGTYPNATGEVPVNALSYPVYNEVLGLFALLETPKIEYWNTTSVTFSEEPPLNVKEFQITHKAHLKEPLRYAFNPTAGIDIANVQIQASYVVEYSMPEDDGFSQATRDMYFNNVEDEVPPTNHLNTLSSFHTTLESDFVALDEFNSMSYIVACHLKRPFAGNEPLLDINTEQTIMNGFPEGTSATIKIKLIVTIPFTQLGHNGQNNSVTQIYTYVVPNSNTFVAPQNFPLLWSITTNPNGASAQFPLEESLGFGTKFWTQSDYINYGGTGGTTVKPHAWSTINIFGNQTRNFQVSEVLMKAGDEIVVSGDVIIPIGFTLTVGNFNNMTSSPNPPVDNTYLASFCAGQSPNSYHANQPRNAVASNNPKPTVYEKRQQIQTGLGVFPNPTTETLNLSLLNFSGQVQFEIYNAIGNKLQSFSKTVDNGIRMNYVTYSAADLPNGTYTIVARMADGTSVTEQFVVLK